MCLFTCGKERMMKQMSYHVNTWGIWVKGIQEFFAAFPKLLRKSDFKIKWKKKTKKQVASLELAGSA